MPDTPNCFESCCEPACSCCGRLARCCECLSCPTCRRPVNNDYHGYFYHVDCDRCLICCTCNRSQRGVGVRVERDWSPTIPSAVTASTPHATDDGTVENPFKIHHAATPNRCENCGLRAGYACSCCGRLTCLSCAGFACSCCGRRACCCDCDRCTICHARVHDYEYHNDCDCCIICCTCNRSQQGGATDGDAA